MSTEKGITVVKETGEIIEGKPAPLVKLTDLAIETIAYNIKQAEKLVFTVLEPDVDYGIHPGTNSIALREPGASKIANAFNTYPDHKILNSIENEDTISFLIQASLISRESGQVVATGVGGCSTMESKYGFRWVENPEEFGYDRKELRQRKGKYRIPNPEISDLGNTILKMAAKRAEADAAQELPGVGSALRKLFEGKGQPRKQPDWEGFWGRVRQMGLLERDIHDMLEVKSMTDWLKQGKTLDDAINTVAEKLAARGTGAKPAQPPVEPHEPMDELEADLATGSYHGESKEKPARDPDTLKTLNEMFTACNQDFKMQPAEVIKELGYSSKNDISDTPAECYRRIAAIKTATP